MQIIAQRVRETKNFYRYEAGDDAPIGAFYVRKTDADAEGLGETISVTVSTAESD